MSTQHGITTPTYERVMLGPGKVYTGAAKGNGCLGATLGGNVLEINRTFLDIRPDGAKGKVKGFRYLENGDYTLTVKLLELTEEAIYYALAGSSLASHVITGGEIAAATYIAAVYLDVEMKGVTATIENTLISVCLANCLVEGPMVINAPEKGPVVIELKFTAHYAASDLTTEPFKITFTPAS